MSGCKLMLSSMRALDAMGWPVPSQDTTALCASCVECTAPIGESVGEYRPTQSQGDWFVQWSCPSCGASVVEHTTPLMFHITVQEVKDDNMCVKCRNRLHTGADTK